MAPFATTPRSTAARVAAAFAVLAVLTSCSVRAAAASSADGPAGIASASSAPGAAVHPFARKLLAPTAECAVYVKNACKSKKSLQVAYAVYRTVKFRNGGGASGWDIQGWYRIPYGKKKRFTGPSYVYIGAGNKAKPSTHAVKKGTGCGVANSKGGFRVLQTDRPLGYYWVDKKGYTGPYYTCQGLEGQGPTLQAFLLPMYSTNYCFGATTVYTRC